MDGRRRKTVHAARRPEECPKDASHSSTFTECTSAMLTLLSFAGPTSARSVTRTVRMRFSVGTGVPTRFLHDCRRTAARNLIRASVPERVAMLLTGHKSRAIFDRYNIINEQELLDAGDQLVEYLAQQAQAVPARRRSHAAGPAAALVRGNKCSSRPWPS